MTFWQRHTRHLTLAVFTPVILTITACGDDPTDENLEIRSHHSVQAFALKHQDGYQVQRNFSGVVRNKKNSNLNFEVAGKVQEVFVNEGENIKKGALLAQLDSELLNINKQQLNAQLSQIKAQINLNKANLDRVNKLISSDYASRQRLDELNSEQQVLVANKQQINANIKALQYQIDNSTIYAPFSGVINQKNIVEGEVVNPQVIAFVLLSPNSNELKVGIPKQLIGEIKKQKTQQLIINGQNISTDSVAINSEVNKQTRTVQLRFDLPENIDVYDNQPGYFKFLQHFSDSGFWVPVSALTDGIRGTWNVYVLNKTNNNEQFLISSYTVNVLHTEQQMAFIQVDLENGQQIVATGLHRYVPGEIVTINGKASHPTNSFD